MRVVVPSRPGALGALASALGSIGADISLVEIVDRRPGRELDELILDLPADQTVPTLVASCDSIDGVQVQWVRNYPRGGGIEHDVELQRRMLEEGARSAEILVAAAPLVFRADWGVLVELSPAPGVGFRTPAAPDLSTDELEHFRPFDSTHRVALPAGWSPGRPSGHAVVAPMAPDRAVLVGRHADPAFFSSELVRLSHLAGAAPQAMPSAAEGSAHDLTGAHRIPIAPPLYTRDDAW